MGDESTAYDLYSGDGSNGDVQSTLTDPSYYGGASNSTDYDLSGNSNTIPLASSIGDMFGGLLKGYDAFSQIQLRNQAGQAVIQGTRTAAQNQMTYVILGIVAVVVIMMVRR